MQCRVPRFTRYRVGRSCFDEVRKPQGMVWRLGWAARTEWKWPSRCGMPISSGEAVSEPKAWFQRAKDMERANNSGEAVGRNRTGSTCEIGKTTASVINPLKEK